MEATVGRSLMKFTSRHSINTIKISKCHPLKLSPHLSPPLFLPLCQHTSFATLSLSNPNSQSRNHFPNWKPSLFTQSSFQSNAISADCFAHILSSHNDKSSFAWKFADRANYGKLGLFPEDKRPVVTVVVLGWLGSKPNHLKRYAEMYNLLGMDAITFAAPVSDIPGFPLGKKLETRVAVLTDELVSWLEKKENDGRDRLLIFHTFSNTGWLAYGYILNKLKGRQELLEKIKGCVVDSGGDPELDPKVWAAGFTTAILKKQSSAINFSSDAMEPPFIEGLLLSLFEKFFAYVFQTPDIKRKLTEITSTLQKDQQFYPQLYLYSTSDTVIPAQKIESFIENQKKIGRNVTTFNFKLTPHVDHYRAFPDKYRSLVENFLKDCFAPEGKQLYNSVK